MSGLDQIDIQNNHCHAVFWRLLMRFLYSCICIAILLSSACIFGNSDPEVLHMVFVKSLGTDIDEYFDNGCFFDEILLTPRVPSQDNFYLVESPELLDSVFEQIVYQGSGTPRLDTLFPEGGSLLILDTIYGWDFRSYEISASRDSVIIDISGTLPPIPYQWVPPMVIPVGIVTSYGSISVPVR